jgi:hypothetical protein
MQYFDVFLNQLSGTLPVASLQQWTNLSMFNIENNTLTGGGGSGSGSSSSSISAFDILNTTDDIESFRTSFNSFTGAIPDYVFERPLPKLQQFWAAGNQLVGTIPTTLGLASSLGKTK